jgi:hypothetical protein
LRTAVIPAEPSATARCERRAEELSATGFTAPQAADFGDLAGAPDFGTFHDNWNDLPMDEAMPAGATYRQRRYGRLHVEVGAADVQITALGHAPFRQAAEHIPLHMGKAREFAPIARAGLLDPALHAMVAFDVAIAAAASGVKTWTVNVHMVRIVARSGLPGEPTPEGRHRDGHLFVGMHLLRRDSCGGGESIIYLDDREIARLMLVDPLDSLMVDDKRVTHEVTAISARAGQGTRDMLLVDMNAA